MFSDRGMGNLRHNARRGSAGGGPCAATRGVDSFPHHRNASRPESQGAAAKRGGGTEDGGQRTEDRCPFRAVGKSAPASIVRTTRTIQQANPARDLPIPASVLCSPAFLDPLSRPVVLFSFDTSGPAVPPAAG